MTLNEKIEFLEEIMDLDTALGSRIYEKSKGSYLLMTGEKNWRLR